MEFNCGTTSPTDVSNPNDLEPDQEDKTFYCFTNVQVDILRKSDILDLFLQSNVIFNKVDKHLYIKISLFIANQSMLERMNLDTYTSREFFSGNHLLSKKRVFRISK